MGRRMAEGAALLVDHVLPVVGYWQWVLSFTGPMAQRLGYDPALLAEVAGALARAVMHDMRWAVKERHDLGSGIMSRSAIVAVARSIPGVLEVTALLNAFIFGPNPLGIPEPVPFPELGFVMIEGFYIDFTGDWAHHLTIRSVATPQRDCCDLGT